MPYAKEKANISKWSIIDPTQNKHVLQDMLSEECKTLPILYNSNKRLVVFFSSEMLMKKLSLLCDDDFVDLDKNIIQKMFTDHFSDLLNDPEIIQKPLCPCILSNIEHMVECWTPDVWFSLFECPHCYDFKIVPHSYKSKFRNSCGVKYSAQRADFIKSIVLDCPHRHVVLTIAEELWQLFQYDRKLLNLMFFAASDTLYKIFDSFGKKGNHFKPAFKSPYIALLVFWNGILMSLSYQLMDM